MGMLSFAIPILAWCVVSYVPFVWHPMRRMTDPGDVDLAVARSTRRGRGFRRRQRRGARQGGQLASGYRANPVFLPAPHAVARALVTGFTTSPARPDEPWLHQSLWHSIQVIFWGFLVSSLFGVPLGHLMRRHPGHRPLNEPFIEFFRYLPAPGVRRAGGGGARNSRRAQGRHHLHRHLLSTGARHCQHHATHRSRSARSGADARRFQAPAPLSGRHSRA